MNAKAAPVARADMLIRRPVKEVFEAFINPEITCKFWFTRGSGRLEQGKALHWHWDMYGVSADIKVKAVEQNRRILIEWPTPVEWLFTTRPDNTTFVRITASGFTGSDDERVSAAIDSMGGFCFLLAGCKAFLEHGIELNLTGDHNPDANIQHGS